MMRWIRLYTDILDDTKIRDISDFTYKMFTFLLLFCGENDNSGCIKSEIDELSWRFRVKTSRLRDALSELQKAGIINGYDPLDKNCPSANSPVFIVSWAKRQYKSDNVNERSNRFRAKNATLHATLHATPPDTEQKQIQIQNKIRSESNTQDQIENDIDEILNLYSELIKPRTSDNSNSFAKEKVFELLKAGISKETLLETVQNYHKGLGNRDFKYRKNAGNFFGEQGCYENYTTENYIPARGTRNMHIKKKKPPATHQCPDCGWMGNMEEFSRKFDTPNETPFEDDDFKYCPKCSDKKKNVECLLIQAAPKNT